MTANKPPSGAQKAIGDIAPKLADLTDDVLHGARYPEAAERMTGL